MTFDELISPWTRDRFVAHLENGDCFVIRGHPDKFRGLITLEEIEARINDGCNWNAPLYIINDQGSRSAPVAKGFPWSNTALKKKEVLEDLSAGRSFMMTNLSQINPRISALIDGIEEALADYALAGDLHLYVSPRAGATAYNAHRDYPQHKIYVQVLGKTNWTIFNHTGEVAATQHALSEKEADGKLIEAANFELESGDLLYMPPAVFHRVLGVGGGRVSLSLPFSPAKDRPRMDRTYIPFARLFQAADTEQKN